MALLLILKLISLQKYTVDFFHEGLNRQVLYIQTFIQLEYAGLKSLHRKPDRPQLPRSAQKINFYRNSNLISSKIVGCISSINVSIDTVQLLNSYSIIRYYVSLLESITSRNCQNIFSFHSFLFQLDFLHNYKQEFFHQDLNLKFPTRRQFIQLQYSGLRSLHWQAN